MHLPFGEFNSHFVADPFTRDIGEIGEVAVLLAASHEIVEISAAAYDEESEELPDVAARIAASAPEGALGEIGLSLGASFITNIVQTDGLADVTSDIGIHERTMGLGGFFSLSAMGVFLEGEVITALGDIEVNPGPHWNMAVKPTRIKPRALNLEMGYCFPSTPVEIAGRFEQLLEGYDHTSAYRFGGVLSLGLFGESASLALEFLFLLTDDDSVNGASIAGQLAVEF
jgi:hypothetical protein